jgi:two-component system, OmpR family, sensor histidine kinase BaeS
MIAGIDSDDRPEMRTPLAVLGAYLEGLQDGVTDCDQATIDVMNEQLGRLTRLAEDINDVSRAEEGRIIVERTEEPVTELVRIAVEANREAYETKRVKLCIEEQTTAVVYVDRHRLGQVLGNLLSNAVRHTPSGGQVTITAARNGNHALIRVSDTGAGLRSEELPHVFERFYRGDTARDRDHGGTGIGLTISKSLTEAHGGTLTAASAGPGRGAVFTVELPIQQLAHQTTSAAGS